MEDRPSPYKGLSDHESAATITSEEPARMKPPWAHLQRVAQAEVESIISALPMPVRRHASPLPISYEARPADDLVADGYEPDLLGLFVGSPLAEPDESPLPPQIILFLE